MLLPDPLDHSGFKDKAKIQHIETVIISPKTNIKPLKEPSKAAENIAHIGIKMGVNVTKNVNNVLTSFIKAPVIIYKITYNNYQIISNGGGISNNVINVSSDSMDGNDNTGSGGAGSFTNTNDVMLSGNGGSGTVIIKYEVVTNNILQESGFWIEINEKAQANQIKIISDTINKYYIKTIDLYGGNYKENITTNISTYNKNNDIDIDLYVNWTNIGYDISILGTNDSTTGNPTDFFNNIEYKFYKIIPKKNKTNLIFYPINNYIYTDNYTINEGKQPDWYGFGGYNMNILEKLNVDEISLNINNNSDYGFYKIYDEEYLTHYTYNVPNLSSYYNGNTGLRYGTTNNINDLFNYENDSYLAVDHVYSHILNPNDNETALYSTKIAEWLRGNQNNDWLLQPLSIIIKFNHGYVLNELWLRNGPNNIQIANKTARDTFDDIFDTSWDKYNSQILTTNWPDKISIHGLNNDFDYDNYWENGGKELIQSAEWVQLIDKQDITWTTYNYGTENYTAMNNNNIYVQGDLRDYYKL